MSITQIQTTRPWTQATDNNGLYWESEFRKVYTLFGGIGAMVWQPAIIPVSSSSILLNACVGNRTVYSTLDSSDPYSGWSLLVQALRARTLSLGIDESSSTLAEINELPFTNVNIPVAGSANLYFGSNDTVLKELLTKQQEAGDMVITIDTDILDSSNNVLLVGGEYRVKAIPANSTYLVVQIDGGSRIPSPASDALIANNPKSILYTHRIMDNTTSYTDRAQHFSYSDRVLAGAGAIVKAGAVGRPVERQHKHIDSGHEHDLRTTSNVGSNSTIDVSTSLGNNLPSVVQSSTANIGAPTDLTDNELEVTDSTIPKNMGGYFYYIAGQRATS